MNHKELHILNKQVNSLKRKLKVKEVSAGSLINANKSMQEKIIAKKTNK